MKMTVSPSEFDFADKHALHTPQWAKLSAVKLLSVSKRVVTTDRKQGPLHVDKCGGNQTTFLLGSFSFVFLTDSILYVKFLLNFIIWYLIENKLIFIFYII
jgi:hypothetical protein